MTLEINNLSGFSFNGNQLKNLQLHDLYFDNVTLLLQPRTDDTTIIDYSRNKHKHDTNNASLISSELFSGHKAINYNSLQAYTRFSNPSLSLLSGDFTIECWIKFLPPNTAWNIYLFRTSDGLRVGRMRGNGHKLGVYGYGAPIPGGSVGGDYKLNEWTHVALIRKNNIKYLLVDGVVFGSSSSTNESIIAHMYVGNYNTLYGICAHINSFRMTRSVARYNVAGFTPPATAFAISK